MGGRGRGVLLSRLRDSCSNSSDEAPASPIDGGRGVNKLLGTRLIPAQHRMSLDKAEPPEEDELMNYCPMKEAYEDPKFNSYAAGPGQLLKPSQQVDKRREKDAIKLHVANIPSGLSRDAIENIFNLYGDTSSVYVKEPAGCNTTWGFVEYRTLQEAQNAIAKLHTKQPYHLRVRFAKEKEAVASNNHDSVPPFHPVETSNPRPGPLKGVDPRKFRTVRKNDVPTEPEDGYKKGTYSNHSSSQSEELNNQIMERVTEELEQNGRVMRGGRSCTRPRPINPQTGVSKSTNFNESEQPKKPNADQSHPPSVYCPFKGGKCTRCSMPTMTACSICKMWYCGYDCSKQDWEKHKNICKPRTVSILPNGQLEFLESDEKENVPIQNNSGGMSFEDESSSQNVKVANGVEPHFMNGNEKDFSKSVKVNDNELPVVPKSASGLQQIKSSSTNRIKEFERNIIVRDSEEQQMSKADDKASNGSSHSTVRTKKKEPPPPIPREDFTECVIVFTTSEDPGYFVTPSSEALKQDEMMCDLLEYFSVSRPKLKNPHEGALCAAQFIDKCWYRARVVSVDKGDVAFINFIDFGNEQSVPIDLLMELPEKFAAQDPLAFRISFSEEHTDLKINDIVKISPIKRVPDGSWQVRLQGDPEPPAIEDEPVQSSGSSQLGDECVSEESQPELPNQIAFPLSKETFKEVTIMHKESLDHMWVITAEGMVCLLDLSKTLEEHASEKTKVVPRKNDLYNFNFSGCWCRALLTSLNPYSVFFIDYGNDMDVEPQDLRPLPPSLQKIPPLAIRIKLAEGTPSKYRELEEISELRVKAIKKLDNAVLAIVEGVNYPPSVLIEKPPDRPTIKKPTHALSLLKSDSKAYVIVTKGFGEDNFCGTLQIVDCTSKDFENLADISTALQQVCADSNYRPKVNDDVLVKVNKDSRLYRGYVVCTDDGITSVALTDLGCVETPTVLNTLPPNFKDVLPSAVRIVFTKPFTEPPSTLVGSEITLRNIVPIEDGQTVNADFGEYGQVTLSRWTPLIEEARIPAFELENKTLAFVTAFHSPQAIYLRPLTEQCVDVFNCIIQDVGAYGVTAEPMQKTPLCGELVCARWKVDNNFYRALVSKKENGRFKVSFLDFGNAEIVEFEDLRPLPDHFKKIPATCVKVGLKDVPGPLFNRDATKLMNDMTLKEIRVVVTHEQDLRRVVLVEETSGDVVNNVLAQAMQPSWVTNPDSVYTDDPYMDVDVRYNVWTEGAAMEGVVVGASNYNMILFVARSPEFEYINNVLTPQITKYCEGSSLKSYSPRNKEFILAKFEGDWYRALCVEKLIGSDVASVFFVDYGNTGELSLDDIRKMAPEFAETPAAVKFCKIYGLPRAETISEEQKKKLTELVETLTRIVVVREYEDGRTVVWAPELEKHLTTMGLSYSKPIGLD